MSIRIAWDRRLLPVILCIVTLVSVGVLLLWDILPGLFPARAHDFLAAFPLALIALTCLVYEAVRCPSRSELVKSILLACAFLFWAANQFWPALRQARRPPEITKTLKPSLWSRCATRALVASRAQVQ